jgi:hypothetical protein
LAIESTRVSNAQPSRIKRIRDEALEVLCPIKYDRNPLRGIGRPALHQLGESLERRQRALSLVCHEGQEFLLHALDGAAR